VDLHFSQAFNSLSTRLVRSPLIGGRHSPSPILPCADTCQTHLPFAFFFCLCFFNEFLLRNMMDLPRLSIFVRLTRGPVKPTNSSLSVTAFDPSLPIRKLLTCPSHIYSTFFVFLIDGRLCHKKLLWGKRDSGY